MSTPQRVARRPVWSVHDEEVAQASIESLLVTGVVTVLLVAALVVGLRAIMPGIVGYACPLVDSAAVLDANPALAPSPAAPGGCFGP